MLSCLKKYILCKNNIKNQKPNMLCYINSQMNIEIIVNIYINKSNLTEFNNVILFKNLIILDLADNNIKKIDTLPNKLLYINLNNNNINKINNLNNAKYLKILLLSNNNIKKIKYTNLDDLYHLDLSNNYLKYDELKKLVLNNLLYINISYNKICFKHNIKLLFPKVTEICLKYNY